MGRQNNKQMKTFKVFISDTYDQILLNRYYMYLCYILLFTLVFNWINQLKYIEFKHRKF